MARRCQSGDIITNRQLTFGNQTMTYDANGNLGTITVQTAGGPQVTPYTWDQRNRLGTLAGPSLAASFGYDGLGRRTSRTVNAASLPYLYDGVDILREGVGIAAATYLRGLGVDETFARGNSEFYLTDALGSTVALTNAAGNLRATYSYEPFGRTQASGPASTNPFQFTGRENDGTGLYYYRARYYHPGLARFLSEDPIGFAGGDPNLYTYAGSSPVRWSDPSGLYHPALHRQMAEIAGKACGLSGSDLNSLLEGVVAPDRNLLRTLSPSSDKHAMAGTSWPSYVFRSQAAAIELHRDRNNQLAHATLGRGLHALQDSFVHDLGNPQGTMKYHAAIFFADFFMVGSAKWFGDPDEPTTNPIAYYAAQRATYDYLADFMRARGIKSSCP